MMAHEWKRSDLTGDIAWKYTLSGGNSPGMGWYIDFIVYETTHPELLLMFINPSYNSFNPLDPRLEPTDHINTGTTMNVEVKDENGNHIDFFPTDQWCELPRDDWKIKAFDFIVLSHFEIPDDERPR